MSTEIPRVYEVGHNELEDRAIRRLFPGVPEDTLVYVCAVAGDANDFVGKCAVCNIYVLFKVRPPKNHPALTFLLCEPCLDSAMTRLRTRPESRRVVKEFLK